MFISRCALSQSLALLMVAIPFSLAVVSPASAQVTVFKAPPSAAQFRQALFGAPNNAAPAATPATETLNLGRSRSIVWKGAETSPSDAEHSARTSRSTQSMASADPDSVAGNGPAAGLPISFSPGSTRIAKRSKAYIDTVADVLLDDPTINLVIEGHTDSTGSYPRNMVLSWERAMGVYKVLVQRYGIEPKRLQPIGKGPGEPLEGLVPSDGENRRVQFRLASS